MNNSFENFMPSSSNSECVYELGKNADWDDIKQALEN